MPRKTLYQMSVKEKAALEKLAVQLNAAREGFNAAVRFIALREDMSGDVHFDEALGAFWVEEAKPKRGRKLVAKRGRQKKGV